ncbi:MULTISPECIES: alpha/beta hydrolase [unclassified Mesorhizobium]|uniref:alpha/beta hydrolase n=1 Tax=unclassified Mesorhizobium TaxID=325217 RepID=UPI000FCBDC87|nr:MULTISPECIES: alpha/beta hydrolase [unclassified Mesorhizobium]RUZ90584.1 alpha/beta hydrolase [Mesorhizobium sp. M7A.F.Ca.US.003.02.2.1]RUY97200.1 alpha/beta hydrolase [Mesorhizobium sp. M7A.F.Ca.CA.001.12.2.1]RUZ22642.1 alpha/beta hydrolase [Mesorhizobium sp. M7A.F.Ca.US.007.01.2.1]RUZ47905.1 alpha/beta hydrolase [Mesorhizobium sp. M7A.F.Ca.US.003.02.1.1]RUZ70038.1 alpha/beta hydrolase [Mesorhizobium sp. M7A.F.Ca.US.007.01.1.1]
MTDYIKLIDAETWAFIERTNSYYPPDTIDYTIAQQREIYDRMCREFFAGYPEGIAVETSAIATPTHDIPIRIYRSPLQAGVTVLYVHGGGFILGGLDSHDDVCAELCSRTGYEVVSVDYRLAPEHLHPAAFDDAMSAFEWAAANRDHPIVLCGDSAGGNLCAAVSHATRGHSKRPVGQVLIYPGLGGNRSKGSYVKHAEAPMLTVRDLEFYKHIRTGGQDRSGDATLGPLADTDFSNLPPTVLITAECDPLSSDGETYRDLIITAGGHATWFEEPGLVHGYLRARHTVGRARTSFTRIVGAVTALGQGGWRW